MLVILKELESKTSLFRDEVWVSTKTGTGEVIVEGNLKNARLKFRDGKTVPGKIELTRSFGEGGKESRVTVFVPENRKLEKVFLSEELLSSKRGNR